MPDNPLRRLAALGTPSENGKWIIAALEGAQESVGTGRDDPGWFHPSGLAHECEAYLAFRFLGAPAVQMIQARNQRIFDLGTGRDIFLRADMKRSGISLLRSVEEDPEGQDRQIEIPHLRIRGEIDDLVEHPVTRRRYIVDYKTMKAEYWEVLDVIPVGHHWQAHPYMVGKNVRQAYFIYENKNTQELKIKKADFSQQVWDEIQAKIYRILVGIDNDYVNRNPANCSRCPFYPNGVCLANDIAGLKARSGLFSEAQTEMSISPPLPTPAAALESTPLRFI